MARQIFIVNATQVVVSDAHPEGVYSVIPNYPRLFDSRNYDGDAEKALRMAQAEFFERWSALLKADNRAMYTVTLERSDGRQMDHKSFGKFPEEPEPEPEEEVIADETE